ncbi:MAG: Ig-like domain-containing protein [Chitinophagaceae bacterium]
MKNNDIDPEGNSQTVTIQSSTTVASRGTLTLAATVVIHSQPFSGYSGPVNFPYQTTDNGSPAASTDATLYLLIFPSSTLPLDLISFTAVADRVNAKLTWVTANQDNVNRFEIERFAFISLVVCYRGNCAGE